MKLMSALLRLLCGGFLVGFALLKYLEFKGPIRRGEATQLLNLTLSSGRLVLILAVAAVVGIVLLGLGIRSLVKTR